MKYFTFCAAFTLSLAASSAYSTDEVAFKNVVPLVYTNAIQSFLGGEVLTEASGLTDQGQKCEVYLSVVTRDHTSVGHDIGRQDYLEMEAQFTIRSSHVYSLGFNPSEDETGFFHDRELGGAELLISNQNRSLTARSFLDVCETFVEGSLKNQCFVWSEVKLTLLHRGFFKNLYSVEMGMSEQVLPGTNFPAKLAYTAPACNIELNNFGSRGLNVYDY